MSTTSSNYCCDGWVVNSCRLCCFFLFQPRHPPLFHYVFRIIKVPQLDVLKFLISCLVSKLLTLLKYNSESPAWLATPILSPIPSPTTKVVKLSMLFWPFAWWEICDAECKLISNPPSSHLIYSILFIVVDGKGREMLNVRIESG